MHTSIQHIKNLKCVSYIISESFVLVHTLQHAMVHKGSKTLNPKPGFTQTCKPIRTFSLGKRQEGLFDVRVHTGLFYLPRPAQRH